MELDEKQKEIYIKILCETMKAFIAFCKKNNLRYYADGGTCLGAVRHKGLIPWDDDIDVLMPRGDYNRFLSLKPQLEDSKYEILDPSIKGYYLPFAKFSDKTTTIYEYKPLPFIIGVFVDVFPLDEVGNDDLSKNLSDKRVLLWGDYRKSLFHYKFSDTYTKYYRLKPRTLYLYVRDFLVGNRRRRKFYERYLANEREIQKQKGNRYIYYGGSYGYEKSNFPKEWFADGVNVPFEDFSVCLPLQYDLYLKRVFGDYMTPPPIEKRVSHHYHYFIDLTKRWNIEDVLKLNLGEQTIVEYVYE